MRIETELLPPLPVTTVDGYGWLAQIGYDGWWRPVWLWGSVGRYGRRPYVVIAHFAGRTVFAVARYVAGDVTVTTFDSVADRDAYTGELCRRWGKAAPARADAQPCAKRPDETTHRRKTKRPGNRDDHP